MSAIRIDDVQHVVAAHYKVDLADLLGPSRAQYLVRARHMAMALAYSATRHSYPEIGRAFGRHHSSVMHAREAITDATQRAPEVMQLFDRLWREAQALAVARRFAA